MRFIVLRDVLLSLVAFKLTTSSRNKGTDKALPPKIPTMEPIVSKPDPNYNKIFNIAEGLWRKNSSPELMEPKPMSLKNWGPCTHNLAGVGEFSFLEPSTWLDGVNESEVRSRAVISGHNNAFGFVITPYFIMFSDKLVDMSERERLLNDKTAISLIPNYEQVENDELMKLFYPIEHGFILFSEPRGILRIRLIGSPEFELTIVQDDVSITKIVNSIHTLSFLKGIRLAITPRILHWDKLSLHVDGNSAGKTVTQIIQNNKALAMKLNVPNYAFVASLCPPLNRRPGPTEGYIDLDN